MRFRLLYILFFFCSFCTQAQEFPALKFNQLTIKDGLSTNAVRCTYIDPRGIVWIATSKGLNRYDGTGVTVYHHKDGDSTSICNDAIESVLGDAEGYLWLATINGLSRFNPATGTATNYLHETGKSNSLASNEKCEPFIDSKGRLWLATWAGVQRFDYKKKRFFTYQAPALTKPDPDHFYNTFTSIAEDAQHRIWALSAFGIYRFDEKTAKLLFYDLKSPKLNTAFLQTGQGELYLGTLGGGINQFNPENRSNTQVLTNLFGDAGTKVNDLAEWTDNDRHKWICIAANGGIILTDPNFKTAKTYSYDNLNGSSLHAYAVYHITKDKQNRLWLSTDEGINIVDPYLQNFENLPLYQQSALKSPKLYGLPVNILRAEDQFYVTSYRAKGIYVYNRDWKFQKHLNQVPETSKSELSKSINSIYYDEAKNFWFSTDSGLVKKTGNSYKFFFLPDVDLSIKTNLAVSKLYKRKDGLFWIRARQNGIYIFDPKKGVFIKNYRPDGQHIDGVVYACLLDRENILWVGATRGLSFYVPQKDEFQKVKVKDADGKEVQITWVTDITADRENTVWAVSDMGLVKVNRKNGTGLLINQKMGLPENYLKRIMIDSLGYLWIPSQQGVIKYDRKNKFTFFGVNNGLPVQYEGHGFFEPDGEGNFLIGFSGYVTRFNPYSVKTNETAPNVIFMDIAADGIPISIHLNHGIKSIELAPGTRIVNLHFAISNYTAPQDNRYYYRLGEMKGHWQPVKNGDIALGSLPEGKYTLFVKGSNNDGVFSPVQKLEITVLPHWYETWWFRILAILILIGLVTLLIRRRIAVIRRESGFKQSLVESELKAIRAQMNPHFIFNVLNSIESFIVEHNPQQASAMVQKFANLCRLVLENSTQSLVSADREWKAIMLYAELEALRFEDQFAFDFNYTGAIELHRLAVPPMLFQPLIENAIHHGLRNYPGSDGRISVVLDVQGDLLKFTVKDNGVGLHATRDLQHNNLLKQKSLAIKGIKERIAAINSLAADTKALFEIREIKEHGETGTIAVLVLPLNFI